MTQIPYLEQAKVFIQALKDQNLSIPERRDRAIELAAWMLQAIRQLETSTDRKLQQELGRMMEDPEGKVFTMNVTDQCFRSENSWRVADQLYFLMRRWGIPHYLSALKRIELSLFKIIGRYLAPLVVPLVKKMIYKECSRFILPGEKGPLTQAIRARQKQGLRINLNHLGEAILGEEEAKHRLKMYLEDLARPEVEYISVKVSTIFSQLHLIAWEETLTILSERLIILLQTAHKYEFIKPDGSRVPKFVNLDMEEYRDLDLTVELFKKVLSDPNCYHFSAGIVLQSYLPDSYLLQQDLTIWAMQRQIKGGAPIKIRIVKGANLAMEQVDSSLHGWPQAPYLTKGEVDANFKRMINYACIKEHAQAAHVGIGSHNLFDIAYGLLIRAENGVEKEVCFEMLEGMADAQRQVVQYLAGEMLLYCPAASRSEFQNAVAYLVRRLDENTSPENYLRQAFKLQVNTAEWKQQVNMFAQACDNITKVTSVPRRKQNRFHPEEEWMSCDFENVPDTDWSLSQNRSWAQKIIDIWSKKPKEKIPLVIAGKVIPLGHEIAEGFGFNPSKPGQECYSYALAEDLQIEEALKSTTQAQAKWSALPIQTRSEILEKAAKLMKFYRADLIGVMMLDTGKTIYEADVEVSEAVDFLEYYRRNREEIENLEDLDWQPKGPVLIAPPWNFPCSIPVGGIAAALAAGNCVIFKPAPEAVWVGWLVAQIFWQAGVGQDVLQFINCDDEPFGSKLIKDKRISLIVLTGATATAKHMMKIRPDLDLIAETGGKNTIIVTNLADRDQAVKDIIQSAFGHAGQKCSACSLVICHAEVYDDPQFRRQLRDAAASLKVGASNEPSTRINPLIKPPGKLLKRALTQLEEGEEWLLEPQQDPLNPHLWTPGIKWGVSSGNFTYKHELFGPVLGVMKAYNLDHAIQLANQTRYGLTAGLQSLDLREQKHWADHIEAGNCYINRGITGAIVQRQPFGGWKDSCFSPGAKAGGPNYLMQFMHVEQKMLPNERESLPPEMEAFSSPLEIFSEEKRNLWKASVESYMYYWTHYFSRQHDPSLIQGEDNFLRYCPRKNVNIRVSATEDPMDVLRVIAAAWICEADIIVTSKDPLPFKFPGLLIESNEHFMARMKGQRVKRVRFLSKPEESLQRFLIGLGCYVTILPVLANGRVELLRYLREQSLTISYHRYGNLGEREEEERIKENPVHSCCQGGTCEK